MQHSSLKYILDIERVIHEIEEFKELVENDFEIYRVQVVVKRAIERNLEIIGEAVRNLKQINPDVKISSSRKIIGLRNLILHAYDTVEDELIWGIIQKDIPVLKIETDNLKKGESR
jgi:uncharacterized protein with HEPN domain